MEQTNSRSKWKDIVIVMLVLLLLALLIWLFLRPVEPARNIIFGDLGRHTVVSNIVVGGSVEVAPQPSSNLVLNGAQEATNIVTRRNEPGHDLGDRIHRRLELAPTGQGGILGEAGSNSAGKDLSSNAAPESGGLPPSPPASNQTAMAAGNSMPLPSPTSPAPPLSPSSNAPLMFGNPPTAAYHSREAYTRSAPFRDTTPPPPDPDNKDSTAALLAAARSAVPALTSARTADLLGIGPERLFDPEAGSNVVFMLDNSMNMMTNGKSLSARQEVARALQSMNAGQLFYVLFFHSGGYEGMPSLAPLPATPENVRAMTNWLFSVGHRTGADPTKAMQRALGLAPAPDMVWLLSGGPLPDNVIDNIREANESVNAHINTLGFFTRDGEQGLRRIADENRGTYRFIPPPNASPP